MCIFTTEDRKKTHFFKNSDSTTHFDFFFCLSFFLVSLRWQNPRFKIQKFGKLVKIRIEKLEGE